MSLGVGCTLNIVPGSFIQLLALIAGKENIIELRTGSVTLLYHQSVMGSFMQFFKTIITQKWQNINFKLNILKGYITLIQSSISKSPSKRINFVYTLLSHS